MRTEFELQHEIEVDLNLGGDPAMKDLNKKIAKAVAKILHKELVSIHKDLTSEIIDVKRYIGDVRR